MALGKGRTRQIIVDGATYRWRCDFHVPEEQFSETYAQQGHTWKPDELIIRPTDKPHQLLRVTWPACHAPTATPGLVRACIEVALQRGWDSSGNPFTLNYTDLPEQPSVTPA